jgi:hypothetical protein
MARSAAPLDQGAAVETGVQRMSNCLQKTKKSFEFSIAASLSHRITLGSPKGLIIQVVIALII